MIHVVWAGLGCSSCGTCICMQFDFVHAVSDYLVLHLHQAPSEEEIWIELLGSDRCVVDTNTVYESE